MSFDPNRVKRFKNCACEGHNCSDDMVLASEYGALLMLYNNQRTYQVSRKIVQVVPVKGGIGLWAVCDDGTLWCGEFTGAITETEVGKRKSLTWRYISTRAIFDKINGPTISMLEAEAAAREEALARTVEVPSSVRILDTLNLGKFGPESKKMLDDFEEDYRQLHNKDEIKGEPV